MFGLAPLCGGGLLGAYANFLALEDYVSMLIIEDGQTEGGVPDANSLITLAEVSAHATLIGNTTWAAAASDLIREQAIGRVMRWLSSREAVLLGSRTWPTTQFLAYPRTGVCINGRRVESDEIPRELKEALYEASLLELDTPDALMATRQASNIKRLKKKLDGVGEKETEYFGSHTAKSSYPKVMQLFAPFMNASTGVWEAW